jgi:hypothetical protein
LQAQKSNYRRLLIFAQDSSNVRFVKQNETMQKDIPGCVERDLVIENYLMANGAKTIFNQYQIFSPEFNILLIGKDGLVKLRSKEVLPASRIFAIIDAMPMRKDEIRRSPKN